MGKGRISLYTPYDDIVRVKTYDSPKMRMEIIETWKKQYGGRMNEFYIQIVPMMNKCHTLKDGKNSNNNIDHPIEIEWQE